MTSGERPATASEVVAIVGPLEDGVVAHIVATGATAGEVAEARAWLVSDDYLHRARHHSLSGRAAQVFDLLETELPEAEERR